jgi:hypothetical protein
MRAKGKENVLETIESDAMGAKRKRSEPELCAIDR